MIAHSTSRIRHSLTVWLVLFVLLDYLLLASTPAVTLWSDYYSQTVTMDWLPPRPRMPEVILRIFMRIDIRGFRSFIIILGLIEVSSQGRSEIKLLIKRTTTRLVELGTPGTPRKLNLLTWYTQLWTRSAARNCNNGGIMQNFHNISPIIKTFTIDQQIFGANALGWVTPWRNLQYQLVGKSDY